MAGPVRQPIDLDKLTSYIEDNVPDIKTPITLKQFGYGQSNPTYLITDSSSARFVLRKKPPGVLLSKSAHKVDREHRIISALQTTSVPVPKAYVLCTDDAVIGSAFYIMQFVAGRIYEDPSIPGVSAADRHAMWRSATRTLAALHALDPAAVGLSSFGKPSGFYTRQLRTFAQLGAAQASAVDADTKVPVGPLPRMSALTAFFSDAARAPADRGTLVHGDYKIDNVIFHPSQPYVIGVLDWEMATVGHPLADLSNLLQPYVTTRFSLERRTSNAAFAEGADTPGLPSREQVVRWYAEGAGWTPSGGELGWGAAFAMFRDAIIYQGIAARYAARQASSEKAKGVGEERRPVADICWKLIEEVRGEGDEKARL